MAKKRKAPSELHECVQALKYISRTLPKSSPKHIADVYLAAVSLLCHLKVDQNTLKSASRENPEATCPPPSKIPAMTAVIQDQRLFQALINCLRVHSGSGNDNAEFGSGGLGGGRVHTSSSSQLLHHSGHQQHHHHHHPSFPGRKRTNSVSSEMDAHASKAMKLSHSPVPTASKLFAYNRNQADASTSAENSPTVNVQIVAATILYMAFSHVDHWPVQLVRAYAEDCFGPRSWVDDERCKLLVENLSLSHNSKEEEEDSSMEDATFLEDAATVAESFNKLRELPPEEDNGNDQASPKQGRRGSLSSQGSIGPISHSHSTSASSLPRSNSQDESDGPKAKTKVAVKSAKASAADDDGSSSSSGEEDEEVIVTTETAGGKDTPSSKKRKNAVRAVDGSLSPHSTQTDSEAGDATEKTLPEFRIYPLELKKLNLERIRQRYFGVNLQYAHNAISSSLTDRLDSKAKQNSGLLQSLHSFTSIPAVRSSIAGCLEKWLQSPGLSGLARTLFASTVKQMKNVDPPLPADLDAIKKILSMRLKANQLSAHIENVTGIAAKIPTGTISRLIYHQLLSEMLRTMNRGADASASDHLKMVGAVHSALPRSLSADGIAASLLMMIGNSISDVSSDQTRLHRKQLVKHLKHLIHLIAQQMGGAFDSCKLLESLMTFDIKDETWTVEDEEDRARLMFQCVMLVVPPSPKEAARNPAKSFRKSSISAEPDPATLKEKLTAARKLLLTWFCTDYGPHFPPTHPKRDEEDVGAGTPDYRSALGGVGGVKVRPKWLNTARCILFMENGDSPHMQRFVRNSHAGEENEPSWFDEKYRIEQCYEYGCDFDDEMMWIVLKSASLEDEGISADMALTLLEHLFECCSLGRRASLRITDMMLAWELYTLVMYEPPEMIPSGHQEPASQFDDAEEETSTEENQVYTADLELPQLALPGRWWRVTILALVMCGVAPEQIGATVWEEHPTLRAMIKMVTSVRYRFPTVDCDENERSEMKKDEQIMREEESGIAEKLFMSPKPSPKEDDEAELQNHGRARMSARQQQKRERALKKQREKEAAEALLEENRRKKKLRAAQKTIMLWDPTNPARKPPREAAELLVAVESHFGLSKTFQRNVEPDFLLMTIGRTTRGAIERAYDWLIPIISTMPETIARLHASASCVLLLRAYGTEAGERAQLKQLSTPLLRHVSDSLTGRFGQSDAVRAFDLLMADVASQNPDRRRCARRVLYDSIGKRKATDDEGSAPKGSSWMLNILKLEHARSLVGDAIKHMSTAVAYERGLVLRNVLMALDELISYAKRNGVEGSWDFGSVFVCLISSRPSVCAEAMDRFPDLRALGIRTVYQEFQKSIDDSSRVEPSRSVIIALCRDSRSQEATLSVELLQAASVLLSIWKESNDNAAKESNGNALAGDDEKEAKSAITELASMLLHPIDAQNNQLRDDKNARGLASAKMVGTEMSAVSVESWVMLAKARSDSIARRAALTAPNGFLPRLLLCSGLPRASLLTMIDRLGVMGDKSNEQDVLFNQLLVPSATSEWDIGRLGQRREVARRLLGRLSAYLRMNKVSVEKGEAKISTSFLEWLSRECAATDKPRKPKNKQKSKASSVGLSTLTDTSTVLMTLSEPEKVCTEGYSDEELDKVVFRPGMASRGVATRGDGESAVSDIKKAIEENQPDFLEELLRRQTQKATTASDSLVAETSRHRGLAVLVLRSYISNRQRHDSVTRVMLSWVPLLSQSSGCSELWQEIFSKQDDSLSQYLDVLLGRCMALWCPHHIESCCEWILSVGKNAADSKCDVKRLTRYLVLTSGQHSVQVDGFSTRITINGMEGWGKSEEFVSACASIAFEGMKAVTSGSDGGLLSRNDLPDWLVLVLLLAKCGRVQMKFICEAILQKISQSNRDLSAPLLRAVFLRLYVSNPHGMNLGIAMIRAVLMEAAEEYSTTWLDWRSPLDGQLQDMLESVMSGSGQRLVRPLADLSKKHPLLVLRRCHLIVQFLEKDAAVNVRCTNELRGVVHGQSLTGPLNAVMPGKLVKVNVRHWGFSYTEHIWIAFLDVMCAVPGPVLFSCGLNMGVLDFLNVNMRLMFVQSQLRRNERESRLRDKLKDLFAAFRKNNKSGWEKWMSSPVTGLPSLGETKNVMICCDFLDPKDAIELHKEDTS